MTNGKFPRLSAIETTYLVLPQHANVHGHIFGGTIMAWIDTAAACSAYRHSRTSSVTASMDELSFLHPVMVGDMVILKSSVNYAARTSMEIGVKVIAENPITGEQRHTSSAYLTFVAIDTDGKPVPVPPVLPESAEEKRRFRAAEVRREARLNRRGPCR